MVVNSFKGSAEGKFFKLFLENRKQLQMGVCIKFYGKAYTVYIVHTFHICLEVIENILLYKYTGR